MADMAIDPARTGLLIVDLQNDFLHPDGAYARGGQTSEAIAALPARVKPVADALRAAGGRLRPLPGSSPCGASSPVSGPSPASAAQALAMSGKLCGGSGGVP